MAELYGKPMVVVVLEQSAMDLLTRSEGPLNAWELGELEKFKGTELTPGQGDGTPLSFEKLRQLFQLMASINFCMCRSLDFENDGCAVVLKRLHTFVGMDLQYHKDHADLQQRATEWECHGRPHARLIRGTVLTAKKEWLEAAYRSAQQPRPTALQEAYVTASRARAKRQKATLRCLAAIAMLLVCAAAAVAGFQWSKAEDSLAEARRQTRFAEEQTRFAEEQRAEAVRQLSGVEP